MKFKKLNSQKEINVNVSEYILNWEGHFVSGPQTKVKDFLKPYWILDLVLGEFPIPGTKMRVDFINISKKIAIEVSPKSSHGFNKFFHKERVGGFLAAFKRDADKAIWLEQNGFTLVELTDEDLADLTKEKIKEKFEVNL